MKWITSAGGPLLFIAESNFAQWGGCLALGAPSREEDRTDVSTDYDRACNVREYVGLIQVGTQHALVLGGEPMSTTWVRTDGEAVGMFVRWIYAEDDAAVELALAQIPSTIFKGATVRATLQSKEYWLLDSAIDGAWPDFSDFVKVVLAPGDYDVETAVYSPNPETCLVLNRLVLLEEGKR